ncbi:MAG: DUF4199 domain-containing protein [Agriterribacter sp.]
MEKKPVSHFIGGLITACVIIIYSIILNFMDLGTNQALGYVSYVFLFGGIIYFITLYGKSIDYNASFGKLFTFGFKMTALITIIMIAFLVIFFGVFPEFKEKFFEVAREAMIKQGKNTEQQIEMGLSVFKKFFWIFIIGGTIFGYMLAGAIASLIGAAVTKKNPQSPFSPTIQ